MLALFTSQMNTVLATLFSTGDTASRPAVVAAQHQPTLQPRNINDM